MKRLAPVLAALAVAVSTPAHALRTSHLQKLGATYGAPYELGRTDVTALAGGGYVVAWEQWDGGERLGAGGRVFDASGAAIGDVSCREAAENRGTRRVSLAPVGDGFVLGCEDVPLEPELWFASYVRRFSSTGAPAGDASALDDALINQFPKLTARDDDSWLVLRERCDGRFCTSPVAIQANSGEVLGEFTIPRIQAPHLILNADGRFLVVGSGLPGTRARVTILSRRLGRSGETLGPVTRLARMRFEALQVTSGEDGRAAVSWSKLDRSGLRTVYVRTYDPFGEPSAGNVAVTFPTEVFGTTTPALALPLVDGFLLVWTRSIEHWNDPRLTYSYETFVQEFAADGAAIGDPLRLPGDVLAATSVAYRPSDRSWLVVGLSAHRDDGADLLDLYRIGLEHRCGDADGDERVTPLDAQRILRAAFGDEACDPCRCDVDGSGTIDEADAEAAVVLALSGESGECLVCRAE